MTRSPPFLRKIVVRRVIMGSTAGPGHGQNGFSKPVHTTTSLGRWSILVSQLPAIDKIKAIHVYDFDNTLFKTPMPNPKLWNGQTLGTLASADTFASGGWWQNNRFLTAAGEGIEKEEPRAWEGFWNDHIVSLVRLSMQQHDALSVLLTGRSESGYTDLIKRIVKSKGLNFDMIGLKPAVGPNNERFTSTMAFKQAFLTALMETYKVADQISIYEDRPKHVKQFRDFLSTYNKNQHDMPTRGSIRFDVVQVAENTVNLDPVVEIAEVQQLVNYHNEHIAQRRPGVKGDRLRIKKTVFFTGYMISPTDTQRLLTLVQLPNLPESELKVHANNILICPRPCPQSILDKVGGMGAKMMWEVTGIGCFENSIWAASLRPIPATQPFHTDNPSPFVVLAIRKGARPVDAGKIQNWQPVAPNKAFLFETTVSEKVVLRIEPEDPQEDGYESLFQNKGPKRKHMADEDYHRHHGPFGKERGGGRGGRGGGGFGRGGGGSGGRGGRGDRVRSRGGGKGGRGRGGGHGYRSLDDVDNQAGQANFNGGFSYDDAPTAPQAGRGQQPPTQPANFNNSQYQQYGGWQGGQQGGRGGYGSNNSGGGPEMYY